MKNVIILFVMLFANFQLSAKEKVSVSALKTLELTYEEFENFDVELDNKSGKPIDVSVFDPTTNKQVKGFGLGPMGKVVLSVGKGQVLRLKNHSMKDISLNINFVEKETKEVSYSNATTVSFTLHNSSLRSIPLIIPSVMNPNLSPISNSGVALKMGQKIYYKKGGKKKLLLIVDENIQPGAKIDVAQLIKDLEKDS